MRKRIMSALIIVAMLSTSLTAFAASPPWGVALTGNYSEDVEPIEVSEEGVEPLEESDEGAESLEENKAMTASPGFMRTQFNAASGSASALYAASPDRADWISFSPDTPGDYESVGKTSSPFSATNKLFAAEYIPDTGRVFYFRPLSGTVTNNNSLYTALIENLELSQSATGSGSMTRDMAYDADDDCLYLLRYTNATQTNANSNVRLYYANNPGGGVSLGPSGVFTVRGTGAKLEHTPAASTDGGKMQALAVDDSGNGYGIYRAADGKAYLYGIELNNEYETPSAPIYCTLIADTGLKTDDIAQSMTFDPETGMLYWAQYTEDDLDPMTTEDGGHLVMIDPETGEATVMGATAGNLAGLFVGPATLDYYTVNFEATTGGSLVGGQASVNVDKSAKKLDTADIPVPEADDGYVFAGWAPSSRWPLKTWTANLDYTLDEGSILVSTTFTAHFAEVDQDFNDEINVPGSNLVFNRVGQYPWALVEVDGKKVMKSTNSVWDDKPIVRTGIMTSIESLYMDVRDESIKPGDDGYREYVGREIILRQNPDFDGDFKHNTSSTITAFATLNKGDIITFDYMPATANYLYFRVNGEEKFKYNLMSTEDKYIVWKTGDNKYRFEVPADGKYLLEWTYEKGTSSYLADAAFIDNVYAGNANVIPLEEIEVPETLNINVGEYKEIPLTILPDGAVYGKLTWTSSDTSVATVSDKGRVKGLSAGKTEITVTSGDISATCTVTVKEEARPVRFYAFDMNPEVSAWVTFSSDDPSDYMIIAKPGKRVLTAEYVGGEDGNGDVYGYFSDGTFFKTKLNDLGNYTIIGNPGQIPFDMAYDYTRKKMYAIAYAEDGSAFRTLNEVDLETGKFIYIEKLVMGSPLWTLAITTQGVAYGLSDTEYVNKSFLHEVNLSNAKSKSIGSGTGAYLLWSQSMTYDHKSGRMFWAQYHYGPFERSYTAGLYEVDVDTGVATKLGTLRNNIGEYVGLMVVRNASVESYYSDKGETELVTGISLAEHIPDVAAFYALPSSGYAKLSDGGYESVSISWAWKNGAPGNERELYVDYDVVGTITGGTFAHGKTIEGTVTFVEVPQMPVITAQPTNKNVTQNDPVTLSVTAEVSDGGSLSYQWYASASSNSGGASIPDATSETYSPDTSTVGTKYYSVVVTNTRNNITTSATSSEVAVTVNKTPGGETPIGPTPVEPTPNEPGPSGDTSGGGTSGGSTSGSSTSGSSTSGSTSTTTTTGSGTSVAQVTVKASTATVGGVVTSTASVTTATVASALSSAKTKRVSAADTILVEIKVDVAKNAKAAVLELPGGTFAAVANEKNASLSVDAGSAKVIFDTKALETIAKAAGDSNVSVSVSAVDVSTLSREAQNLVGTRPVFDIKVLSGGKAISNFNGGIATVSVPYTPSAIELKNPAAIMVYYIDETGKLKSVPGKYNAKTGTVDFETGHLSLYAVAFNLKSYPDVPAWAKDAVTFTAARGIVSYSGSFMPDKTVTRGEFLIALMKTYAIDVSNPKDEYAFADISKDRELYAYAAVAREMGITNGSDAARNLFAPDDVIDRQQIAVFFIKALNAMNRLPAVDTGRKLSDYTDGKEVAAWAAPYVETAVKAGLINSTSRTDWVIDPALMITRSQMVQLIYNLFA